MIARTCSCGRRVEPGQKCSCKTARTRPLLCRRAGCVGHASPGEVFCSVHLPTEADRLAAQPWRAGYKDPEYAKNRELRYEIAGGCCEDCGIRVTDGEYQSDHVVPLSEGGTHRVENLRIRCTLPRPGAPYGCAGLKTASDRRRRSRRGR